MPLVAAEGGAARLPIPAPASFRGLSPGAASRLRLRASLGAILLWGRPESVPGTSEGDQLTQFALEVDGDLCTVVHVRRNVAARGRPERRLYRAKPVPVPQRP